MNRRSVFSLAAISALGIAMLAMLSAAHAQTAQDLVGTWQFVSSVTTASDGTKSTPKGPHALGVFIFDGNGHVAFIKLNPDVPKFAANNAAQGTPEENKAVVIGSEAYIGTYSLVYCLTQRFTK